MQRHPRRQIAAVLLLLIVSVAAVVLEPGSFSFRWENGRCWLQAQDASVRAVLKEVSATTGIPIITNPSDKSTITVTLADRDIEEVMRAVCSGASIIYEQDPETGEYYIEKIVDGAFSHQRVSLQGRPKY